MDAESTQKRLDFRQCGTRARTISSRQMYRLGQVDDDISRPPGPSIDIPEDIPEVSRKGRRCGSLGVPPRPLGAVCLLFEPLASRGMGKEWANETQTTTGHKCANAGFILPNSKIERSVMCFFKALP